MRSSYATRTAADAVRQRRSASSSRAAPGVELMKLRHKEVGSCRTPRNLLQARQEYSSSRLARAALARESLNLHRHSVPSWSCGAGPTQTKNRASGSLSGALRSPSGTAAAKEAAADAAAPRLAFVYDRSRLRLRSLRVLSLPLLDRLPLWQSMYTGIERRYALVGLAPLGLRLG